MSKKAELTPSQLETCKAITRRLVELERDFPGVTFSADIPGIGETSGKCVFINFASKSDAQQVA